MSAPAFTPGPLKAVGREVWVLRNGVEAGMLCRSEPETPSGSTYGQSGDEVIANARLIAAAPDYGAFTVEALPQLEVLHSTLPAGQARVAVWRVILNGRAASAKARGEQ